MTVTTPVPRRPRALPALALAAVVALSGCASPDGADPEGAPEGPAADLLPAAEGTTEYPLTLTTWAGETVLEERPERVAVIGFSPNLDALEAIGATPVYALSDEDWEWRDPEWLSGVEVVDTATRRDPLNFEGIAASAPDLIVAANFIFDENDYERLSDIAPVLDNPEQVEGDQIDWRETQRMVGEALDLGAAAEEAIDGAEQAVGAVAAEHPEFAGRTITIAYDYAETGMDYYTVTGGTAEGIVGQLGFEPNPLAEEFVADPGVSEERLGLLDADLLVVFYNNDADRRAREEGELFRTLAPVAEDRYVSVLSDEEGSGGNATWVLRRGASALSVPWAVEVVAGWAEEVDLA
ncbi:iron complex transport system substrate-binding protein [Nocardiopsis flavescens]|uniref:Iron complex transport system substrate-binding protein n=1 Tax=Nocardiopsis flavescens TaxID=758803 RepID=A0A1M6VTF0_9ACTN|nr:ABC transporter substrate-binding protein [Nocardiopsis flavescens]SHK84740.1 iron complex transport system substrate-binding protein [Nocardiopsis flavescens]